MTLPDDQPGGELQALLDHSAAGAVVKLVPGDYEGPVAIRQQLTLDGSGATIWASFGPVITVESPGVVLRNLSIQVTDLTSGLGGEDGCALALRPQAADLRTEDVLVAGAVAGADGEEGEWVLPSRIDLGSVEGAPGSLLQHTFAVRVPVACTVRSDVAALTVEPAELRPGTHQLALRVPSGAAGGELAGALTVRTRLVARRTDLFGRLTIVAPQAGTALPPAGASVSRPAAPAAPVPASSTPASLDVPLASPAPASSASATPSRAAAAAVTAPSAAAAPALPAIAGLAAAVRERDVTGLAPPVAAAVSPRDFRIVPPVALGLGLLAALLAASRSIGALSSPWATRAALVLGAAAAVVGASGLLPARRAAGSDTGRSLGALAAGALALFLEVWGPASPPSLASISALRPLPPPTYADGEVTALALSPDGGTLASGGSDHVVRVFRTRTGQPEGDASFDGEVHAVALSPDGKTVAGAGSTPKIGLWSAENGQQLSMLRGPIDWVQDTLALAFSPDGRLLAAGGADGVIRLWNLHAGDTPAASEPSTLTRHDGAVQALAFSADGHWLASGGRDMKVLLWEVATAEPHVFRGFSGEVLTVAASDDGSLVAAGTKDGTIWVWNRESPTPRQTLRGLGGAVLALQFSADARLLASAVEAPGVVLWDLASDKPLRSLQGAAPKATEVSLAHGGAVVAAASDGKLSVWHTE